VGFLVENAEIFWLKSASYSQPNFAVVHIQSIKIGNAFFCEAGP